MVVKVSGVGVWGGEDFRQAQSFVLGKLGVGHLPFFPYLPARGVGYDLFSRSLLVLEQMPVDLQPYGWRLVSRGGFDQRKLLGSFRDDFFVLAELFQQCGKRGEVGFLPEFKLQILGPWSLLAGLALPSGRVALSDFGACVDVVQAFLSGVVGYVKSFLDVLPGVRLVVQLCEDKVFEVCEGLVPTASGYGFVAPVGVERVSGVLQEVVSVLRGCGVSDVVFSSVFGAALPFVFDIKCDAVLVDVSGFGVGDWERVGSVLESGVGVFFALNLGQRVFLDSGVAFVGGLVSQVYGSLKSLGFSVEVLDRVVLLPFGEGVGGRFFDFGGALGVLLGVCDGLVEKVWG